MDYPCVGCDEGWGQANPWGINSCHDTCKKYWNWLEEDKKMDKPLKDWTLGEIKAECEEHEQNCESCPFYSVSHCKITRRVMNRVPEDWDFSEPPHWTEQDKKDAMMIKRLIPQANQINRGMGGSLSLNPVTAIDRKLFPLLKPGESAMLDEIIGDGDNDS